MMGLCRSGRPQQKGTVIAWRQLKRRLAVPEHTALGIANEFDRLTFDTEAHPFA